MNRREFLIYSVYGLAYLANNNSYAEEKKDFKSKLNEFLKNNEEEIRYKTNDGFLDFNLNQERIKLSLSNKTGEFFRGTKYKLEIYDELSEKNNIGEIDYLNFSFSSSIEKKEVNGIRDKIKFQKEIENPQGEMKIDLQKIYEDSFGIVISKQKYLPYDFLKKTDLFCKKYFLDDEESWPITQSSHSKNTLEDLSKTIQFAKKRVISLAHFVNRPKKSFFGF